MHVEIGRLLPAWKCFREATDIGPIRDEARYLRMIETLYESEGHDGPVYVIEFQAQHAAGAWYNLLTKLGLYGQEHPRRTVQGLLILLHTGDDPGAPPGAVPPLCTAAYLDALLPL